MSQNADEKSEAREELLAAAAGCVVFLEREEFIDVLKRQEEPLLVCSLSGTFRNAYVYLTCYRGLPFAHRTRTPIPLEGYELINAEQIRFPPRRLR
jgi:hypothetical protein